jgi:hypothetical protein
MFKPHYAVTPKLLANIKRIAELTAELNSRRFPKIVLARMERSARELSSYSSTSIEGNPLPLTEVKKILKSRPGNVQKVGTLGNYYDIKDKVDFTPWLEYFTDGIIDELLRVGKELQAPVRGPESQLKPYHQAILDHINKHGYITDREYAKITERAKPTRNLDLKKLIHLGLIEKRGKGKATYYQLKTLEKRLG